MKKNLFLLSAACLILGACEMEKMESPDKGKTAPMEQKENDADRGLTQKIRQSLMDDDALSTNAKNIKIITLNGVVTLRGQVNSDNEKRDIEKKAKALAGVRSVDNQLEVVAQNKTPAPVEAKKAKAEK